MPKSESVDRFFGAVNDAYDALLDAAKAANERGYRVSKRLIDEVEKGQREAVGLTARFVKAPQDVRGLSSEALRSLTEAQGRALDLTRQFLDEVIDTQQEVREGLHRLIEANRTAGRAVIEVARDSVERAGEVVRPAARGGGDGRKAEPARAPRKEKPQPTETEA